MFPIAPLRVENAAEGRVERWYDTNGNGTADYGEALSAEGRVVTLVYDTDEDGGADETVELADVPAGEQRHLLMQIDSVPHGIVAELQRLGRFRLFHRATRIISVFPVMTDLALSEFFGTSPCPGVEAGYFDGKRLRDGYEVYANRGNVPWQQHVDYAIRPIAQAFGYLDPLPWYDHELKEIDMIFRQQGRRMTIGYSVGGSAMGSNFGRNGHEVAMIHADRFCQQLVFETRGRARCHLMSDHGHNLMPSERIPLADLLAEMGYRKARTLNGPYDVVVPQFGIVTMAVVHTRVPERVAHDVLGIEGVEQSIWRPEPDHLVVLSRDGEAHVERGDAGFRYRAVRGDPLEMLPILERLAADGKVGADGFVEDRVLFAATQSHVYPDALYRLWRAFHGLIVNTPDVMVCTADGYHCGSLYMTQTIQLRAAHGNLRAPSSTGFAVSMSGELPEVVRMADLRGEFHKLGVPIPPK